MSAGGFRRGPARVLYSGRLDVVEFDVTTPDAPSDSVAREVVCHPGAVTIVAFDGEDVRLVRQYRVAADAVVTELPAGKLDPGESPLSCAARELEEEAGIRAGRFTELAEYFVSPGWSDEKMWLFLAEEITVGAARPQGVEELHMEVVSVALSRAVEMVRTGAIHDAKSMVGILMVNDHIESRRR